MRESKRERLREEGQQRDGDLELLGALQELGGLMEWERRLLETGAERVWRHRRALTTLQRSELEEILARRAAGGPHEEET